MYCRRVLPIFVSNCVSMPLPRVFIACHSALFAEGLRALLSDVPVLKLVGAGTGDPDDGVAWNELRLLAPDVIILEEGDSITLERIADASPDSRLVALSLHHKRIRVYVKHDVQAEGLEGVIEAVTRAAKRS